VGSTFKIIFTEDWRLVPGAIWAHRPLGVATANLAKADRAPQSGRSCAISTHQAVGVEMPDLAATRRQPDANMPGATPDAPVPVPHKGYAVLQVEFESHTLCFCSAVHLGHTISVLSMSRLPTSRQLSEASGLAAGPNQHWLSRLPAALKSPRKRPALVKELIRAKAYAAENAPGGAFAIAVP
jgi:hypothetical protein